MNRAVIVGAAEIFNYKLIRSKLREDDYFIFCDGGLLHQRGLGVKPDLVIGDFDSHYNPHFSDIETIVLPCEKDDTDCIYAAKEAIKRGAKELLLIGTCGGRFDHSMANISILIHMHQDGIPAKMIDDYSEFEMVGKNPVSIPDSFTFFSLLNVTGKCDGVNIKDAKYPLENGSIKCDYQYAVSNEVLPGKTAVVQINDGMALLVKDF